MFLLAMVFSLWHGAVDAFRLILRAGRAGPFLPRIDAEAAAPNVAQAPGISRISGY
jgi:hypothetical protein